MDEIETQISGLLKEFCQFIPQHVDKWRNELEPLTNKVKGISNMSEQLRAVTEAKIEYMHNFKEVQDALRFNILTCIEDDLKVVRDSIDKISRFNTQLKDKLEKLENASLQLDWESGNSTLLHGTPLIPPLAKLLQDALDFYTFFNVTYKTMQTSTKSMVLLDENSMKNWETAFILDLDNTHCVNRLIAITQYVDNEVVLT